MHNEYVSRSLVGATYTAAALQWSTRSVQRFGEELLGGVVIGKTLVFDETKVLEFAALPKREQERAKRESCANQRRRVRKI